MRRNNGKKCYDNVDPDERVSQVQNLQKKREQDYGNTEDQYFFGKTSFSCNLLDISGNNEKQEKQHCPDKTPLRNGKSGRLRKVVDIGETFKRVDKASDVIPKDIEHKNNPEHQYYSKNRCNKRSEVYSAHRR